jgi:hypothetical protein
VLGEPRRPRRPAAGLKLARSANEATQWRATPNSGRTDVSDMQRMSVMAVRLVLVSERSGLEGEVPCLGEGVRPSKIFAARPVRLTRPRSPLTVRSTSPVLDDSGQSIGKARQSVRKPDRNETDR